MYRKRFPKRKPFLLCRYNPFRRDYHSVQPPEKNVENFPRLVFRKQLRRKKNGWIVSYKFLKRKKYFIQLPGMYLIRQQDLSREFARRLRIWYPARMPFSAVM